MTDDTQSQDSKEIPDVPEAPAQGASSKSPETPDASAPAEQSGPRKILDALDKQAESSASVGGDSAADAVLSDDAVSVSSPSDLETPEAPDSDRGAGQGLEAADVFSSDHGALDPDVMISEAMRKLDKILDEIKAGTHGLLDTEGPEHSIDPE